MPTSSAPPARPCAEADQPLTPGIGPVSSGGRGGALVCAPSPVDKQSSGIFLPQRAGEESALFQHQQWHQGHARSARGARNARDAITDRKDTSL